MPTSDLADKTEQRLSHHEYPLNMDFDKTEWIYLMTNPSMEGQIKIGVSSEVPTERRVTELSRSTSVPTPFQVEYQAFVPNYTKVELQLHADFEHVRTGKEFFSVDVGTVISRIQQSQKIIWADNFFEQTESEREDARSRGETFRQDLSNLMEIVRLTNSMVDNWRKQFEAHKQEKFEYSGLTKALLHRYVDRLMSLYSSLNKVIDHIKDELMPEINVSIEDSITSNHDWENWAESFTECIVRLDKSADSRLQKSLIDEIDATVEKFFNKICDTNWIDDLIAKADHPLPFSQEEKQKFHYSALELLLHNISRFILSQIVWSDVKVRFRDIDESFVPPIFGNFAPPRIQELYEARHRHLSWEKTTLLFNSMENEIFVPLYTFWDKYTDFEPKVEADAFTYMYVKTKQTCFGNDALKKIIDAN